MPWRFRFFSIETINVFAIRGPAGNPIATPPTCSYSFPSKLKELIFCSYSKKLDEIELAYFQVVCFIKPVISEGFLCQDFDGYVEGNTYVSKEYTSYDSKMSSPLMIISRISSAEWKVSVIVFSLMDKDLNFSSSNFARMHLNVPVAGKIGHIADRSLWVLGKSVVIRS